MTCLPRCLDTVTLVPTPVFSVWLVSLPDPGSSPSPCFLYLARGGRPWPHARPVPTEKVPMITLHQELKSYKHTNKTLSTLWVPSSIAIS